MLIIARGVNCNISRITQRQPHTGTSGAAGITGVYHWAQDKTFVVCTDSHMEFPIHHYWHNYIGLQGAHTACMHLRKRNPTASMPENVMMEHFISAEAHSLPIVSVLPAICKPSMQSVTCLYKMYNKSNDTFMINSTDADFTLMLLGR